jgi:hypothetical protein
MGSGQRFRFYSNADGLGVGVYVSRFPFALTINVRLLFWGFQLAFGKGYDE